MPEDAPSNDDAPTGVALVGTYGRVQEMQAKLHRWAVADPGRRFDDLFNFVYDPATLIVAFGLATRASSRAFGSSRFDNALTCSEQKAGQTSSVRTPQFDGGRTGRPRT